MLPAGARDAVRAGADRVPPPRAPRQRAVHVGDRPRDRRSGDPADRGPRPAAVAGRSTRRRCCEDLERLGLIPDEPAIAAFRAGPTPYRQSSAGPAYAAALDRLRGDGLVYACDCSRATFAAYEAERGRPWRGHRVPGRRAVGGRSPRTRARACGWPSGRARSAGSTCWPGRWPTSRRRPGTCSSATASGNWTYAFCVVVDDLRHDVDLVIRGRDLLHATAGAAPARAPPGAGDAAAVPAPPAGRAGRRAAKLSKADGDTAVRSLLDAGATAGGAVRAGGAPRRAAGRTTPRSSRPPSGRCSPAELVGRSRERRGRAQIGGRCQPPEAASTTAAAASATSSRHGCATSCTPIGRPSGDVPPRTTTAGQPVRLWTSL